MTARNERNRKPKSTRARKRRLAAREKHALSFETLESRQLLAAITVTNATDVTNADTSSITALIANDGGDGVSLREAITAANNTTGEDTITFDGSVFTGGASSVARLMQGELEITESLTIDASSATDLVITGDTNGDDVTLDGTFITDSDQRFVGTFPDRVDVLDDNSRVINFTDPSGDLILSNLTLTGGNIADNGGGGGIRFDSSGTLTGTSLTISGNRAQADGGGGISTNSGSIYLINSNLSENRFISDDFDFDVGGGAIYGGLGSTISLTNSLVSDNFASGGFYHAFGGGVFSRGNILLTNSTLSGNGASGGYLAGGGGLTGVNVVLTNSTVTQNSTSAFGMSVTNPTGSGGGLDVSGDLTIINSVVAGNGADFAPDVARPSFGGGNLILENSLIGGTEGSNITATTGSGNILNQPALLGPLADNGGPTLTHALLAGSPAINAGSNGLAVDAAGNPLTTDQRGENRIKFGTVDIGAVESDFDSAATAPVVTNAFRDEGGVQARPDLISTFTVTFDQNVDVSQDDLFIFNETTGTAIDSSGALFGYILSTDGTPTATWVLSSLMLDPAFYSFELSSGITSVDGGLALDGNGDGTGGDDFVDQHYVAIPGDANLDGIVDVLGDAFSLVANLNSTTNIAWADGDFNGDGVVDVLGDAFALVGNLGQDVRPPVALAASSSNKTTSTQLMELNSAVGRVVMSSDVDSSDGSEDQDESFTETTTMNIESSTLALAGDYDLRDHVFGSDF